MRLIDQNSSEPLGRPFHISGLAQIASSILLALSLHMAALDGNVALFFWALLIFGCIQVAGRKKQSGAVVGMSAVLLAILGLAALQLGLGVASLAVYLPSTAINCLLFWIFFRSLLPGRRPLITHFRLITAGWTTREINRYTRGLTVCWAVLFVVFIVVSVLLALKFTPATWSWVVNIGFPIVSFLFFVLEHFYRSRFIPQFGDQSMIHTIKTIARPGAWSSSAAQTSSGDTAPKCPNPAGFP